MVWARLKRFVLGGREDGQRQQIAQFILSDEKLARRVEEYREFHEFIRDCLNPKGDKPEKRVSTLAEYIHKINEKLHNLAVPYGRAGSEAWYARAMDGWSVIHTRTLDMVRSVQRMMKAVTESQKAELEHKLLTFFTNFYVQHALFIAEISWMREDVAPSYTAVINQILSLGGQGLWTPAGERKSGESERKGFPDQLSSEVR